MNHATAFIANAPLVSPSRDIASANRVINTPEVLPGLSLGLFDAIDIAPLLEDDRNHLLLGEFGGALLRWTAPGVYEVHDFVLPEGRGTWAKSAAGDVFSFVFSDLRARLLWTMTPIDNRASRMFNRIIGMRSEGIHQVPVPGSDHRDFEYFTIEAAQCQ